jgi:hypothetical protein
VSLHLDFSSGAGCAAQFFDPCHETAGHGCRAEPQLICGAPPQPITAAVLALEFDNLRLVRRDSQVCRVDNAILNPD